MMGQRMGSPRAAHGESGRRPPPPRPAQHGRRDGSASRGGARADDGHCRVATSATDGDGRHGQRHELHRGGLTVPASITHACRVGRRWRVPTARRGRDRNLSVETNGCNHINTHRSEATTSRSSSGPRREAAPTAATVRRRRAPRSRRSLEAGVCPRAFVGQEDDRCGERCPWHRAL